MKRTGLQGFLERIGIILPQMREQDAQRQVHEDSIIVWLVGISVGILAVIVTNRDSWNAGDSTAGSVSMVLAGVSILIGTINRVMFRTYRRISAHTYAFVEGRIHGELAAAEIDMDEMQPEEALEELERDKDKLEDWRKWFNALQGYEGESVAGDIEYKELLKAGKVKRILDLWIDVSFYACCATFVGAGAFLILELLSC